MLRITPALRRPVCQKDLDELDWPAGTVAMQKDWIGRSEGAEIDFQTEVGAIRVFTTRPDTLFGATYLVLAPEHPLVDKITTEAERPSVEAYRTSARAKSDLERTDLAKVKTGVFTGGMATHPGTGQPIPIWIADYVLSGYGTGAIMAVPAHDTRDHEFARKFGLPIVEVVSGGKDVQEEAFVGDGTAVNSPPIDGASTADAKAKIGAWLEAGGLGKRAITYKLRDWLFSRQRYWGEPFPIIHCPTHDAVAVPGRSATGQAAHGGKVRSVGHRQSPRWRRSAAGSRRPARRCGVARHERETDTMPNWAGSNCWYYLRFMDPTNASAPFSKALEQKWGPVDLYVGGGEHSVLPLLYARFWHKFFHDLGLVHAKEPFQKLRHQGMVLAFSFKGRAGHLPWLRRGRSDRRAPGFEERRRSSRRIIREDVQVRISTSSTAADRRGVATAPTGLRAVYGMTMGDFEATKPSRCAQHRKRDALSRRTRNIVKYDEWAEVTSRRPGDPQRARARHGAIKFRTGRSEDRRRPSSTSGAIVCRSPERTTITAPPGATRADPEPCAPLVSWSRARAWPKPQKERAGQRSSRSPARWAHGRLTIRR